MPTSSSSSSDLERAILDTARQLLVKDGYQQLSMRKIARKIGYSATSIYLHFSSKDALVHTLIDEGMDRLNQDFHNVVKGNDSDPINNLEALCRIYIDFGLNNPEYYKIMFMLDTSAIGRYPADKYRRASKNLRIIEETLVKGAEKSLFHVHRPKVTATALWAILHGAVSLILSGRMDYHITKEELIDTTVSQFMRSCLA